MKIAVACVGTKVSAHFGHCESFRFYSVVNEELSSEILPSPVHETGALPKFVAENDANVIIAGGMGSGAVNLFNSYNIEVIVGNLGEADEVVQKYIDGELKSTGSICNHHDYEDDTCEH